jgi:hypothetical protein
MATMGRERTEEEPTNRVDNIPDGPSATDWRRMTDATHDTIARRAYELYKRRDCEPGYELDDWFQAEHEVQLRRAAE